MASDDPADPPADAEPLLNRSQLAGIFGVSENTVDKWRAKGLPVEIEGGNGQAYGFRFSDCRAWYDQQKAAAAREKQAADDFVAQQRMEFLGIDKNSQKARLSPAQIRELAQAELIWMQAAERRGALIQVEDAVELLDLICSEMRAAMDGQPDWLEREFSLSGDQVEKIVRYNDGILKRIKEAIEAAALSGSGAGSDPLDGGLF